MKVEIKIETTSITNMEKLSDIVRICDSIRYKSDNIDVIISINAPNVSTLVNNPLKPLSGINSLYDDMLDDESVKAVEETDYDY